MWKSLSRACVSAAPHALWGSGSGLEGGAGGGGRRALLSLSLHSRTSGKLTFPGDLLVTVAANAMCPSQPSPVC